MSVQSLLARLTGWPKITTKYRARWRVMINTHPLVRGEILCRLSIRTGNSKRAAMLRIEPVLQIHTLRTCACLISADFVSGDLRALWGQRRPDPAIPPMSERFNGALQEIFS
jgi:hypothetical protein